MLGQKIKIGPFDLYLEIHLKNHSDIENDKNNTHNTKKKEKNPPDSEVQTQELLCAKNDLLKKKKVKKSKITANNTEIQKEEIMEDTQNKSNEPTTKKHQLYHSTEGPFKCGICGKGFISIQHLETHMVIHTDVKPYSCDICGKSFAQVQTLKNHKLVHTGDEPFGCDVCSKKFGKKNLLETHLKTHADIEKDESMNPNKNTKKKIQLDSQLQLHAKNDSLKKKKEKRIKIKNTEKGTKTEMRKKELVEDKQTESKKATTDEKAVEPIKIYKITGISIDCEFCDENFGSDYNYRHHLKIHNLEGYNKEQTDEEKTEICEICDYRYKITKERNPIYHHYKTFHKVSKKLRKKEECYICHLENGGWDPENGPGTYFYSNEGLRIHMRRQHETEDWKYRCYTCNARFKHPMGLKDHFISFHYRKHLQLS